MNEYISLYSLSKELETYLTSAILAFKKLKEDRLLWQAEEKQKNLLNVGWRGDFLKGFRIFFDPKKTAKNIQTIEAILDDLYLLQFTNQNPNLDHDKDVQVRKEVIRILNSHKSELTKGQTQELVEYIIGDINSINFSSRRSSLIKPDAHAITFDISSDTEPYTPINQWDAELHDLLLRKKLPGNLFVDKKNISFNDDIAEHVRWAFNHIYKVHYIGERKQTDHGNIARYHHGIQHVTRAATYIPVLANLYRKHGDKDALALTDDDLKLIQIAAVFHDGARENEGEDHWDHESGIFLYLYLTRVLHVEKSKAKLVAEAMANKDPNEKGYFVIFEKDDDTISWNWTEAHESKNIYEKLIHDADCLDIIRARDTFEGVHLDFYKQFGAHDKLALDEIAQLITEARSLIEIEGDSRNRTNTNIKEMYEHGDAYIAVQKSIRHDLHPIMAQLSTQLIPVETLQKSRLIADKPFNPREGLTDENMSAAIREGKVFVRGIGAPSAKDKKRGQQGSTLASEEIYKTSRQVGIPTRTQKSNNISKEGNPLRSVSMIGYGSGVFTNAGFMIVDPDINDVNKVYAVDSGTGRGKKAHIRDAIEVISKEEKQKQLTELNTKLKLGGSTVKFGQYSHTSNHVEILYHIKDFSAIYFSNDPNLYNDAIYHSPEASHRFSPILQAIFLHNEYKIANPTKPDLPVFEYSAVHNYTRRVPDTELSQEAIKQMWVSMCSDFIKQRLADINDDTIFDMPVDDIKTLSMYKIFDNPYADNNAPADTNYDKIFAKGFRQEISDAILAERLKLIEHHRSAFLAKVHEKKLSIFSDEAFSEILRDPSLCQILQQQITEEILTELPNTEKLTQPQKFLYSSTLSKSVFDELPYNKDVLLKENQFARKLFYESKIMRMYTLANQLGLTKPIAQMKDIIAKVALKDIQKRLDSLHKNTASLMVPWGYMYEDLVDSINFTTSFGIYPGDKNVKKSIDNFINEYFQLITKHLNTILKSNLASSSCINSFCNFVSYLTQVSAISPKQAKEAKSILTHLCDRVHEYNFEEGHLINLLDTCHQYQFPQDKLIKVTITWMQSHQYSLTSDSSALVQNIKKIIPLHDPIIFKELVARIATNTNPNIYGGEIQIGKWANNAKELKDLMPNGEFTKDQLSILSTRANGLIEKLMTSITKTSSYSTQMSFVWNLFLWLKSDLDIKIDNQNLSQINQLLDAITIPPTTDAKEDLYMLKLIHENLESKDARPRLNQMLAEDANKNESKLVR